MFELDVAWRHIVSNRRGTAFTLISVAIAVGVIVMSLGLTEGTKQQIIENTVEKNPHLIISPKEGENYIYLYRSLSSLIGTYPGVKAVSPRLVGQGAARFRDRVEGVEFTGIRPDQEDLLMAVQDDMTYGRFSDLLYSRHSAVLGSTLAENLGIRPGGEFYLSQKNRSVKMRVAGLMRKGTSRDSTLVYLPLETAQSLSGAGDVVSEIGVKLSDFSAAPEMAANLSRNTRYKVTSWQDFNREIARFVGTQSRINDIFYVLIFLISGFVIANTTVMIVTRRTREIGILMAMGANRRSVLKIFLLESLLLSPPAGVIGALIGFIFAQMVALYPLDVSTGSTGGVTRLMLVIRPEFFIYAILFALGLNVISGIYPAYVAARLDPVQAIGSET